MAGKFRRWDPMLTRREFSRCILAGGSALLASGKPALAGESQIASDQRPKLDCDLLIKGGTVIDPGQQLHAALDVAVKDGRILAVSQNIPESGARNVISAKG